MAKSPLIARLIGAASGPECVQRQYAALPVLVSLDAAVPRIALVTSRDTGRWVIPKGWPHQGRLPHEVAEIEAREEAGLIGEIAKQAAGTFRYRKRLHGLTGVICEVEVYRLNVTCQLMDWKEKAQRTVSWLGPEEAARRVDEPELAELLRRIEA
ncbi:MAG: NUDIX hydrolase [Hyphomicrobiaceae bacterium]